MGEEVTAFSVITDYDKGIKYPLADFNITPDVAIVDPSLAETMPKKLTAHTGMDAMTHAIEAYVSTANCDYTDALALHAMKMIKDDLVGVIVLELKLSGKIAQAVFVQRFKDVELAKDVVEFVQVAHAGPLFGCGQQFHLERGEFFFFLENQNELFF